MRYLLLTSLESTSAILLQGASDVGESIVLFVDLPLLMQEDPFMLSLSCFFSYRWVSFSYFLMSERFLAQFLQHSLDYDKLFSSIYTSVYIKWIWKNPAHCYFIVFHFPAYFARGHAISLVWAFSMNSCLAVFCQRQIFSKLSNQFHFLVLNIGTCQPSIISGPFGRATTGKPVISETQDQINHSGLETQCYIKSNLVVTTPSYHLTASWSVWSW